MREKLQICAVRKFCFLPLSHFLSFDLPLVPCLSLALFLCLPLFVSLAPSLSRVITLSPCLSHTLCIGQFLLLSDTHILSLICSPPCCSYSTSSGAIFRSRFLPLYFLLLSRLLFLLHVSSLSILFRFFSNSLSMSVCVSLCVSLCVSPCEQTI